MTAIGAVHSSHNWFCLWQHRRVQSVVAMRGVVHINHEKGAIHRNHEGRRPQ